MIHAFQIYPVSLIRSICAGIMVDLPDDHPRTPEAYVLSIHNCSSSAWPMSDSGF